MSTQMVPMHSPEGASSSNTTFGSKRFVRFGAFHLDLKKEELYKDGARVKLQGKVYQALVALLQKAGEVVKREDLRMELWPSDTHVNYDANVNTTVNKLRQVLGDSADQSAFVDTIPRQGYSFIAKVEFVGTLNCGGDPRTRSFVVSDGFCFQVVHRWRGRSPDRQHLVWCGAGVVRASLNHWFRSPIIPPVNRAS